jgi:hypothetical protein
MLLHVRVLLLMLVHVHFQETKKAACAAGEGILDMHIIVFLCTYFSW